MTTGQFGGHHVCTFSPQLGSRLVLLLICPAREWWVATAAAPRGAPKPSWEKKNTIIHTAANNTCTPLLTAYMRRSSVSELLIICRLACSFCVYFCSVSSNSSSSVSRAPSSAATAFRRVANSAVTAS